MSDDDDDESSQGQYSQSHGPSHTFEEGRWGARDARPLLPKAAFFMGDLRDGLPMVCVCVRICVRVCAETCQEHEGSFHVHRYCCLCL